ncbi:uncharacterized protein LOC143226493 [Tachypleus tridentatus]|uniref:uncharacterized protein LOC143226493 n=1 Tax=Tachypleus tridentatus TaxID=6853 RepID=UPI003FD50305
MKEHCLAFSTYLLCFTITSYLSVLVTGSTVAGDKMVWNSNHEEDEPYIRNTRFLFPRDRPSVGWNFAVKDDGKGTFIWKSSDLPLDCSIYKCDVQSLRRPMIKPSRHQSEIFSTLQETSKKQRPTFDPGWHLMGLGKRAYMNQPFYDDYNEPLMLDSIDRSNKGIQTSRHPELILIGYDRGVKGENSGQLLHVNEPSLSSLSKFFDRLVSSTDSEDWAGNWNAIDYPSLNTDKITISKPQPTVYGSYYPDEFYLKTLGSRILDQRRNANKRSKTNEKNLKIKEPHKMFLAVLTMNNLRRFFDELTRDLKAKDDVDENLIDSVPEPLNIRPVFVVKTRDKGRTHTKNKKPWILWQEKSKPSFDPGWNWPGLGRK